MEEHGSVDTVSPPQPFPDEEDPLGEAVSSKAPKPLEVLTKTGTPKARPHCVR